MKSWVPPVAGLAAFLVGFGGLFLAPASAARLSDGTASLPSPWLPAPARQEYDAWAQRANDDAFQFFALGNPDKLIQGPLRLVESDPAPGTWHGSTRLTLAWTDLGDAAITYDVRAGREGVSFDEATPSATTPRARADVAVPGDGNFTVWVRPATHRPGAPHAFGPFLVDASAPGAPRVSAPLEPPGYSFDLSWTASSDTSGIAGYEVERRRGGQSWEPVAFVDGLLLEQEQVGNGDYEFRVRALNGAGVPSAWSNAAIVRVRAPMSDPGVGQWTYGIHANFTTFLHVWDLSDPSRYLDRTAVPAEVKSEFLGSGPSIETDNATLKTIVNGVVGSQRNTLRIAELLFEYLFDHADYDSAKSEGTVDESAAEGGLQRAGLTLDRGKGICGDLAVLYITLLRIAGVPARPVHGYLDNARSQVGGFHMWVEVYVGPVGDAHAWLPVDVSGVNGPYDADLLYAYFGVQNPEYLALGSERNYERYGDGQWNTWARYQYVVSSGEARPSLEDRTTVDEYDRSYGRLFFDPATSRRQYVPCRDPDPSEPDNPCPTERAPPGFRSYYGVKGMTKKRLDYGALLSGSVPRCLRVDLRVPDVDAAAALNPDQSAIFHVYERSSRATVAGPDADAWVRFVDGSSPSLCAND